MNHAKKKKKKELGIKIISPPSFSPEESATCTPTDSSSLLSPTKEASSPAKERKPY